MSMIETIKSRIKIIEAEYENIQNIKRDMRGQFSKLVEREAYLQSVYDELTLLLKDFEKESENGEPEEIIESSEDDMNEESKVDNLTNGIVRLIEDRKSMTSDMDADNLMIDEATDSRSTDE